MLRENDAITAELIGGPKDGIFLRVNRPDIRITRVKNPLPILRNFDEVEDMGKLDLITGTYAMRLVDGVPVRRGDSYLFDWKGWDK